jgi:hypothetical protein
MKTAKLPGFTAETSIYNCLPVRESAVRQWFLHLLEEGPLADSVGEA